MRFAFMRDIPVMLGYITMGIAFGLMLEEIGYNFVWAFFTALFVFAGTMQFVLVSILTGGANILTTIIMTFSINSRHVFYGLSFLTKFREMGKAYPYMIFSLTDETYALLCGTRIPSTLNENKTMLCMAALNHSYWVIGCTLGAVFGQLITFDITGVDFAMTALFVVICVDQWREARTHIPAVIGAACGAASLLIIGPANFIIPAMLAAVAIIMICRKPIEKKEDAA
ncbi:MAG: AzlC family ABC transporter permease [Eubacteriaceae bacterium]|nr:AzlC family ABC transporter permease [Eubacteriaceae bacterium]